MDTSKLRAEFLDEVKQAVCQDRTKSHGQPEDNFKNIAWLWTGWLRGRHRLDVSLDVLDVGYMSILLKVARAESNPRHLDHATDSAGYAACIGGGLKAEGRSPVEKLLKDLRKTHDLIRPGVYVPKPIPVSEKVPEPKSEFKATHIADNLDLVRLVSMDGDSIKYETQDGCLATVSREYFFSVFQPLSEKVPEIRSALPYQRKRDKAKVRVLFREGDKVTYHFEDHAVPKALELPALLFDAEFEPVPTQNHTCVATAIPGSGVGGSGAVTMSGVAGGSTQTCTSVATGWERVMSGKVPPPIGTGGLAEPWKPTHKYLYGSRFFVRVLKSTSDEVRYETEQRIPWSLTHRDFADLFIPVSE